MIKSSIKIFVISTIAIVAAGCADFKSWHKNKHDDGTPSKQFYDTRLYLINDGDEIALNKETIENLRDNPEELDYFVSLIVGEEEPLSKRENRARLRDLVRRLNGGSGFEGFVPDNLKGIGGIQALWTLDYLLCSDAISDLNVVGKIDKWIYDDERSSGYIYWSAKRTDCSGVDRRYEFHIAVDGSYVKHPNEAEGYFDLLFPDLKMEIPYDERKRIRKQKRHFDYKLHAEGSSVIVLSSFIDGNLVASSNPIYISTKDTCIDVLFREDPPSTQLPVQEWYCMGRCNHPPLINTGGA